MKRFLIWMLALTLLLCGCGKPTDGDTVSRYRIVNGSAVEEADAPTETALQSAAKKVQTVVDTYLSDTAKVYYAAVPDKNYYTESDWDYTFFRDTLRTAMAPYTEISLWDTLTFDDYYKADLHWKQECLGEVVDRLCTDMGAPLPVATWQETVLSASYRGSYADLDVEDDTLIYLTSDLLDGVTVTVLDPTTLEMTGSVVYDMTKQDSHDLYNIFLSGAMPLITLENPHATSEKSLVIFRDSYTSSLAPLLTESYRTVTLVDLRYIVSKLLPEYVDLTAYDDALFLYSMPIWCNSTALKVFA